MKSDPNQRSSKTRIAKGLVLHALLMSCGALLAGKALDFFRSKPSGGAADVKIDQVLPKDLDNISLVLALHPTCIYCNKSMDFYRPLVDAARLGGIPSLGISTAPLSVSAQYYSAAGLNFDMYSRVDPSVYETFVTPTISIVGTDGRVIKRWRGLLGPEERRNLVTFLGLEDEYELALPQVESGTYSANNDADDVSAGWLNQNLADGSAILVDTRSRSEFRRYHKDGAINMPLDELEVLAASELDKSRTVVLYCVYDRPCAPSVKDEYSQTYCKYARDFLSTRGFTDVRIITEQAYRTLDQDEDVE